MPTQIYKNAAGKRLPSVTGIIGRFRDSGGLLYWANQQGLDGKTLDQARRVETTPGTIAHALVEAHINGRSLDVPDMVGASDDAITRGKQAFESYRSWESMVRVKFHHTEVGLVSERHQYGGCMDAVGVINNGLAILDWKAGSLYADHLYQLAAYGILWHESYPKHHLEGGYHLCSFGKETGDFSHRHFPTLTDEAETFLLMRALYDRVKATEKRVR